jgi:hypothetical protein
MPAAADILCILYDSNTLKNQWYFTVDSLAKAQIVSPLSSHIY